MGEIQNDGIVIFSTKSRVMFTSAGEIEVNTKKLRKHNKNRSIVHQIFEDMKEFNDSSYWDEMLTKFSRNNFSKNFKYYNDTLHYKTKKKNSKKEFYLDPSDLSKTLADLKDFLEDKGFASIVEWKEKPLSEYKEEVKCGCWKDFGPNQIYLVEIYIDHLQDEYSLDEKGRVDLESVIKFGISCDIFNNSTINIEDAKIESIKYLEWDDDEERFYIDFSSATMKFSSSGSKRVSNSTKSGKYSSHTFSGDTFFIKEAISGGTRKINVCEKWKEFLTDYYC